MKTSELIGPALDWAVAKCEGIALVLAPFSGAKNFVILGQNMKPTAHTYEPSSFWAQGGPIIERFSENETTFCLFFNPYKDCPTHSNTYPWSAEYRGARFTATTPLIAAMRCYVASKLGEEVEIPEELK